MDGYQPQRQKPIVSLPTGAPFLIINLLKAISAFISLSGQREISHFITLTFWKDLESIRGFAGKDIEVAKYYPEDKDFLLEFEPTVVHYEVVGQS